VDPERRPSFNLLQNLGSSKTPVIFYAFDVLVEGLEARRRDSWYEPGERSGAWMKMRVNAGQELVIAGYTPSPKNFDALVIGLLPGPQADVRRAHPERVYAIVPPGGTVQEG